MRLAAFCIASLCGAALAQDQPVTFGTTVVLASGLRGEVYHIRRNTTKLPDFRKLKPVGTIYTESLNIPPQDFRAGFPGVTKRFEWFAIDYTGRFWIDQPGLYRFVLTADDGATLSIDDELVVDNDGTHPPKDESGKVTLTAGVHRIRVCYFQGPRFQVALVLKIAAPGGPLHVFRMDERMIPPEPEGAVAPPSSNAFKEPAEK